MIYHSENDSHQLLVQNISGLTRSLFPRTYHNTLNSFIVYDVPMGYYLKEYPENKYTDLYLLKLSPKLALVVKERSFDYFSNLIISRRITSQDIDKMIDSAVVVEKLNNHNI